MFICDECLKERFHNETTIFKSNGRCEICENVKFCSDIPSKYLRVKIDKPNGYYHPTTMVWVSATQQDKQ